METTDWEGIDPKTAIKIQRELVKKIEIRPLGKKVKYVAGADISYNLRSDDLYAGIVVFDAGNLEIVDRGMAMKQVSFPYIPGFLSFREIPPLLAAWDKLTIRPDLLMLDGQGIAHPRRMGIATHIGILLDLATIGCAKSRLIGTYEEPGMVKGDASPLTDNGEVIGSVLRTRDKVKPMFISPGHKIDIEGSITCTLAALTKYRMPETTRQAHIAVNELRTREN